MRTTMLKIFTALFFIVEVLGAVRSNGQSNSVNNASLGTIIEAIDRHPELEMARARYQASREAVATHSSLMDPMLILGVQNLPTSFSFHDEPMTSKVIGISQAFSFPGKLSKEEAIGEMGAKIDSFALDEKRNMLRRDAKLAYYDILHRERSIATYTRHIETLSDIEKEVSANAAYGKGPLTGIERISLERTEIKQMIAEEHSMTMMQYAKLAYISGMNLSSVQAPDSLAMPVFSYTVDSLMAIAEHSRPLVLGIRAAFARSNVAAERSDLESYPDFDVMLMYMQRDALNTPTGPMPQMDMLTAQLSVKLPLGYGGKNSAARAEAEAMQRMTLSEEEMTLRDIRMGLTEKLAKLEELRTKHDLLKNLALPSLRMISESFAADYQYDKTSLQSVIGEELSLLHKQHDLFEMESEAFKTIAEIEYIIGADIIPITR